ncbi:energy-coupling factor ABC transporter permease [Aeromicrobium duanguangcaii]|uniref:Energy-coupling factor ABC transporter permease n=1 Tax=Aeromicrobium duanguangcaii TaxID=2968086 RepID=A0ABY5KF34_9ACTN|nr:energy-coupling factor ABC transporter permease [Aeromicrobium duanguangcaii]MCD9154856.1 energy-coupling factor ABC transporter permease [Aeromicrobium duanguangcaii]UUI67732.1 energy-coupling factor ABC transporter permease [Aeromicrobium duanguangcaii]
MHVPDHFLDPQTSIATAAVALTAVVVATRHARRELPDDDRVPMAGLVATFVFAAQMLNFAVGDGTSGHLMGGVLAAVLVGPATAVLCLTAVLAVQALFFADGGVTALGTNVTLMAVVGVLVGWAVFRVAMRLAPRRPVAVPLAAALAALVSVPATALAFTGLYAVGGTAAVDLGAVAGSMLGWHSLIGVGEAAITLAAVAAVMWTRPDLVFGARPYVRTRAVAR